MLYLWLKALHIVAMVCWFAGLFYLPRLFVYHALSDDKMSHDRFCIMERKLYKGIMTPSLLVTVMLGIGLISLNYHYYLNQKWMYAKLGLCLLLVGYHYICGKMLKKFACNENAHSHIFYRWFNELPVLVLVSVIILVVVRPF